MKLFLPSLILCIWCAFWRTFVQRFQCGRPSLHDMCCVSSFLGPVGATFPPLPQAKGMVFRDPGVRAKHAQTSVDMARYLGFWLGQCANFSFVPQKSVQSKTRGCPHASSSTATFFLAMQRQSSRCAEVKKYTGILQPVRFLQVLHLQAHPHLHCDMLPTQSHSRRPPTSVLLLLFNQLVQPVCNLSTKHKHNFLV